MRRSELLIWILAVVALAAALSPAGAPGPTGHPASCKSCRYPREMRSAPAVVVPNTEDFVEE
jgi:hypothetical protein